MYKNKKDYKNITIYNHRRRCLLAYSLFNLLNIYKN